MKIKKKKTPEEVLILYRTKFGELPMIPMMQATGEKDPKYIKMCVNAINRGTPVVDEDYKKFFPRDKYSKY